MDFRSASRALARYRTRLGGVVFALQLAAWTQVAALDPGGVANDGNGEAAAGRGVSLGVGFEKLFPDRARQIRLKSGSSGTVSPLWLETAQTSDLRLSSETVLVRAGYRIHRARARVLESIRVHGILGAANVELRGTVSWTGRPDEPLDVRSRPGLALGLGVEARLYSSADFSLDAGSEVIWSRHDSDVRPVSNLLLEPAPGETATQEFATSAMAWSVSLRSSYKTRPGGFSLAPYCGVRLSGMDIDVDGHADFFSGGALTRTQSLAYSATTRLGVGGLVGLDLARRRGPSVSAELRFGNELSVATGVRWAF